MANKNNSMVVRLDDVIKASKIQFSEKSEIHNKNKKIFRELNGNKFFKHELTNKIGRVLVHYLTNSMWVDICNRDPVNLKIPGLARTFHCLKLIDAFVNKPMDKWSSYDLSGFMQAFIKGEIENVGAVKFKPTAISRYVGEFKRFWMLYRRYKMEVDPNFNAREFEWGLNLRAPKVDTKNKYEDYPDMSLSEIMELADSLAKEEYKVRVLISLNLCGRKCEIDNLKIRHISFKDEGRIFVKLPDIKKNSSAKTTVELFSYAKEPFRNYLKHNKFENEDLLFPSNSFAFAKNLKETSIRLFKQKITPKTLRKLGVCVAERLGYGRADVERIGGWAANSPVLQHYFQRNHSVEINEESENKVQEHAYKNLYNEVETLRATNATLSNELQGMKEQMVQLLSQMVTRDDILEEIERRKVAKV